jgi:hypothetical protein
MDSSSAAHKCIVYATSWHDTELLGFHCPKELWKMLLTTKEQQKWTNRLDRKNDFPIKYNDNPNRPFRP